MANVLTGVKKILFTPLTITESTITEGDVIELDSVIADTVELTQEDPETNTIECETSDSPIYETTVLGKYTITMDSADISSTFLENILRFTKVGNGYAAPSSYVETFAKIEVQMLNMSLVLPKVSMASKLDASSLKTDVMKGTISGTAYDAKIKVGSTADPVTTPFVVVAKKGAEFDEITYVNA